jgi:hypothetical protein
MIRTIITITITITITIIMQFNSLCLIWFLFFLSNDENIPDYLLFINAFIHWFTNWLQDVRKPVSISVSERNWVYCITILNSL